MLGRIFLLFFCFLISGCGFSTINGSAVKTPPVTVKPIDGHLGQLLRSSLEDRFSSSKATSEGSPYVLNVVLEQAELGRQAIQKDATPTRIVVSMTANYTLTHEGKEVLSNRSSFRASSNIVDNPFATYTSSKTSEERLVQLIANDISTRLVAYLKKQ